jgi:hypothetical protein
VHSATGTGETGDTVVEGAVWSNETGTGEMSDAGFEGVVWSDETGITGVPAGPAGCVVQPATDTAAMQMTRSAITLGSIEKSWLPDLINKT